MNVASRKGVRSVKLTKPEKAVLAKAAEILKELSQLASNENDRTNAGLGSGVCMFFAIDEQKPEQPEKPVDLDPTIARAMGIDPATGEPLSGVIEVSAPYPIVAGSVVQPQEPVESETELPSPTGFISRNGPPVDPFARKNDPVLV